MNIQLHDVYGGHHIKQADVAFLYEVLKDRPAEANISHREMPSLEQHKQFVHRKPYECWYIIQAQSDDGRTTEQIGSIYISKQRELGIFLLRAHWGKGYAMRALTLLRRNHPGKLLANVAPGNERSHAFFKAANGRLIQYTYELLPMEGE